MSSVLLGLVAALSWGVNDFLARFPSRAVGPLPTVLAVTFAGLVILTVWLLLDGHSIRISWPQLWLPATSGIFFTLSTLSLFAALALGPVSLVTPIAGSYPALAMFFAVAQGARPSLLQWLAVAGVLTGVVLVSRSGETYEQSGYIPPGKLKTIVALSLCASFGSPSPKLAGKPRPWSLARSPPYGLRESSGWSPSARSTSCSAPEASCRPVGSLCSG